MNQPKRKRRSKPLRQVTVMHGRVLPAEEAAALRLQVSRSMNQRTDRERRQMIEAMARRPDPGDSASIRRAMQSVEHRIVKALWVLEISTEADGPQPQRQHGLGYMPEGVDIYGQAVAKGGWEVPPPRPAVPSSKDIDAAKEAKGWIEWLDDGQARLLTVAAMTKRGDRERRVVWDRVKARLRMPEGTSHRTLQDRYDRALRWIVAELAIAKVG